jgi:hypothetical protein
MGRWRRNWPLVMQKSAVKGLQGISGVTVMVGVAEGIIVADGKRSVAVALICVFTFIGEVVVAGTLAQAAKISGMRKLNICFISFMSITTEYRNEAISSSAGDCSPALRACASVVGYASSQ